MKKILKFSLIITVCLTIVSSTTVSAVTSTFSPYLGYEYNSYKESTSAPIGYLASDTITGSDFDFSVNIESFTDICLDSHDADYPSMFVLDGKAGIVYKTDTSLNIKSIFDKFTDLKGNAVSLKGAQYVACDYANAYFYVYKSNKIYVINSLSKVIKTINASGVVSLSTYGVTGEDSFESYLLAITGDKRDGVTFYNKSGKYLGFSKVGSSLNDLTFDIDAGNLIAIDGGDNRILRLSAVTDFDDNGNEVLKGFSCDEKLNPKVNISNSYSITRDSIDENYYINTTGNKIICYNTFEDDVSYIDGSSIPGNITIKSINYSSICVATDSDTLVALSNEKGPEISTYNSNKGFVKSIDSLVITLTNPTDMQYKFGYVYILDSGNSRILKVDKNLTKVISIYSNFYSKKSGYLSFYDAQGMAIDEKENFYIADTENYRVISSDNKGNVGLIITRPDKQLADTEAPFRATKVLIDRKKQIYIICDSINLGAFVFDSNGEFRNFFGSNTVATTADVILNAIRKKFLTREQLKTIKKVTPISLTNFDIDSNGFVYTVTETDQTRQNTDFENMLRKLNYQGDDVFSLSGNSKGFGDFEWDRQPTVCNTSFNDVDVDSKGYINLIDSGRGKIFQYSEDGDLITVFGGFSNQNGTFVEPVAVESIGTNIYVLDKTDASITVFKPTAYTIALRKAYSMLDSSDSDGALAAWSDILKYNTNSQYPYYGMGRAYEMKGDYDNAMKYFKLADAKNEYSKSYKEFRKDYVGRNIWWMALIVIAVIVLIVILSKQLKKRLVAKHGEAFSPLETKWGLPIYVLLHPVDGFEQFRTRNMQSIPIAVALTVTWFLVRVLDFFCEGFAFNANRPIDYDAFATFIATIGLVILFIIANWAVCTLLNGKGRMKEIICVTAYSLTPMLISIVIKIILTNSLTLDESAFISIVSTLGIIWSAILLLMGLYTIHQYSFGGTVGSVILTVVGMAIIGLLLVLFFTLLQQCYSFLYSVYSELKLR